MDFQSPRMNGLQPMLSAQSVKSVDKHSSPQYAALLCSDQLASCGRLIILDHFPDGKGQGFFSLE